MRRVLKFNYLLKWLIAAFFVVALLCTVFSSSLPDGLEWALQKTGIESREEAVYPAPMAGYTVSDHLPAPLNSILAGLIGAGVAAGLILIFYRLQHHKTSKRDRCG